MSRDDRGTTEVLAIPIPDELVDAIARRVAALVCDRFRPQPRDIGWMDAKAAARYLGLPSVNALHKLTGARELPFSQRVAGAPCFFRRADLDAYREQFMRGGP